jgi:hypothetical protein
MRAIWFSAHSLYGRRAVCTWTYFDQHPFHLLSKPQKSATKELIVVIIIKTFPSLGTRVTDRREGESCQGGERNRQTYLGDITKEDKEPNGDDGLFIEHVELL